jgi:hypothetical protein
MAHRFSRHHICPTSRGGTSLPDNIVRLTHNVHVALHQILDNRLPHEQIERLLDINGTALRDEFKHKIRRQLSKDADWIYQNGVLRR